MISRGVIPNREDGEGSLRRGEEFLRLLGQ